MQLLAWMVLACQSRSWNDSLTTTLHAPRLGALLALHPLRVQCLSCFDTTSSIVAKCYLKKQVEDATLHQAPEHIRRMLVQMIFGSVEMTEGH